MDALELIDVSEFFSVLRLLFHFASNSFRLNTAFIMSYACSSLNASQCGTALLFINDWIWYSVFHIATIAPLDINV